MAVVERRSFLADCIDGDLAFLFDLPKDGLALRSVCLSNGVPEITFEAIPKVPTLTEEDFATVFRLTAENARPEFGYVNFPPFHPLESRWYMKYSPGWLRWTSIGKLLADADWIMKCLSVGVRTDEDKEVFKSWTKSSNLQGLATKLDFPQNPDSLNPTIWMSCENAEIQEGEDEIFFPTEPNMQIVSGISPQYSEYITKVLPSVAYHDEPKLLKMQEVIKLILAVEWLWKKGVRVNKEWMQMHTSESRDEIKSNVLLQKRKKLPEAMIPQPAVYNRPSIDVRVQTRESEMNEYLRNHGMNVLYGYYDCSGTEIKAFTESGELVFKHECMKVSYRRNSDTFWCVYVPIPLIQRQLSNLPQVFGDVKEDGKSAIQESTKNITRPVVKDKTPTFHPPLAPIPPDAIVMATTMGNDYDKIFEGMDPNAPIRPYIPGVYEAVIPNVKSWQELISDFTVPRPRIWQCHPMFEEIAFSANGGVSTKSFPVRREPMQERVRDDERMEERDNYRRVGRTVTVRARNIVSQGTIQMEVASPNFVNVSQQFTSSWLKGTPPQIKFIFTICNSTLLQHYLQYQRELKSKGQPIESESYFHGTDLMCDLAHSRTPCSKGNCGICGITSAGMDTACIKEDSFQRFGHGFYLAPHSSKCDAYGNPNNRGLKAMLLCDVLPGEKYLLSKNKKTLTQPPAGHSSVYGVVGTDLNYPEIVVYDKRAVLPKFIIIYQ